MQIEMVFGTGVLGERVMQRLWDWGLEGAEGRRGGE